MQGYGITYIRADSKLYRFASHKNTSLFLQRKSPRKLAWTVAARRANKKGVTAEEARKRSRRTAKAQRGVVGADLQSILARRTQKPEVREAQRKAALEAAKERKSQQEAKRAAAKKTAGPTGKTTAPKVSKQGAKGGKAGR